MIKENLEKGFLISGTGRKYRFTTYLYILALMFIKNKFDLTYKQASGQLNYYIVTDIIRTKKGLIHQYKTDKRITNARLKNIIELDYEWSDLFN